MGNGKKTMTDTSFPFEFTVPLDKKATTFAFMITGVGKDGKRTETTVYKLQK